MTHVFLTGEIQIGKSTVINKALSLLKVPYAGFYTCFGPDRALPDRFLYMNEASSPPVYDERHAVVRFRNSFPPEAYTERFNALGVKYISEAAKKARLIVLDECGSLEKSAFDFQKAILDTLEGATPVLGVIKQSASGWVDKIRNHPDVRLITVDSGNRDGLSAFIAAIIVGCDS